MLTKYVNSAILIKRKEFRKTFSLEERVFGGKS